MVQKILDSDSISSRRTDLDCTSVVTAHAVRSSLLIDLLNMSHMLKVLTRIKIGTVVVF
jgi:CxxC motif-containing protein